jgi:hypothetical protein
MIRQGQKFDIYDKKQITNHKNNNLLVLVGCIRMLPEIILKI